ncbi:MAG: hypothetical protein HKN12_02325 [Gemmatimonadetes bacterium]|nr:hypothetical protein [Gemmatimonadota bacterium]
MKRWILFVLVVLLLTAPAAVPGSAGPASPAVSLDAFAWLEGDWVRQSKRGEVTETWTRVSPRTMEGIASIVVGEETHVTEHLRIEDLGDGLYYLAKPRENPYPTPFKLVRSAATQAETQAGTQAGTQFVFENPSHDFPPRILYTGDGADGLVVRIEGEMDGAERGIDFVFSRRE